MKLYQGSAIKGVHNALKKDEWIITNQNLLLDQVLFPHMHICVAFVRFLGLSRKIHTPIFL